MTTKELQIEINRNHSQAEKAKDEIIQYARGLAPVLKDRQLEATAKELERLLFNLDAVNQSATELFRENTETAIELLKSLGSEGEGPR